MAFVTIPREIIYQKDFGNVRVGVYSYLAQHRLIDGTKVSFTIRNMIEWMRQSPNRHPGKINDQCINMVCSLSNKKYIVSTLKVSELKSNFERYNVFSIDPYMFTSSVSYAIISYDELENIREYKEFLIRERKKSVDTSGLTVNILLLVLAYVRVNINKYSDQINCCYRHFKTIEEDIGLPQKTIVKAIDVLEELKLIRCREMRRWKYIGTDGKYHYKTPPKIFADEHRYKKNQNGEYVIDTDYDPEREIRMQEEDLWMRISAKKFKDIDYE